MLMLICLVLDWLQNYSIITQGKPWKFIIYATDQQSRSINFDTISDQEAWDSTIGTYLDINYRSQVSSMILTYFNAKQTHNNAF